jgi:hypothetical protein
MQTNSELNGQQKSTQNSRANNNEEQSTNSSVFVRHQSTNEHGYFLRSSVRQNRLDSNNNSTHVANRNGGQVHDDAKRPRHSTNRIRSTSNTAGVVSSTSSAIASTNNNNQQQQSVIISQNENSNKINNSYAYMNNGGAVKRGYDYVDNMDGDQEDEHGNFSSNSMSTSGHRSPAKKPKSLVTFKDMKDFFELLESYPIKDFLLRDSCCLISDKVCLIFFKILTKNTKIRIIRTLN